MIYALIMRWVSPAAELPPAHRRSVGFSTVLIAVFLTINAWPALLFARDIPELTGRVMDSAEMLSPETRTALEQQLANFEAQTSNQIVVMTIDALQGEVLEEYSLRVAEQWRIGQADKDNGVLLLIVRDDRKLRIEVGYGLEGDLPDATCRQIIDYEIVPAFKRDDYDAGVRDGVQAIIDATRGSYVAEPPADESPPLWFIIPFGLLFGSIFLLVVGIFSYFAVMARGGPGWFIYFFLMPFWYVFPAVLSETLGLITLLSYAVIAFILKLFFLTDSGKRIHKSMPGYDSMSGSGGWSSGGSGWSSGGSGFSGGGGSFGGGGSSGSW